MVGYVFLAVLVITVAGFLSGRSKATAQIATAATRPHSRPAYHGAFVALWACLPAFVLVLVWLVLQDRVLEQLTLLALPAEKLSGLEHGAVDLLLAEIRSVAQGQMFSQPDAATLAAAERLARWQNLARILMLVVTVALALAGLLFARSRVAARFRARHSVERAIDGIMIFCALVAIFTTLGIVISLVYESISFFRLVPVHEFLFGLRWEPQIAIRADQVAGKGAFGAVPVFVGTLQISAVAMAVAVPIGLLSAIYLTEYANQRFRAIVKPGLEILAGVPTVVYGFFAVLIVAPALRHAGFAVGLEVAPNSALAAGAVMGIMVIPFVSSLSDDAIKAVPQSMRDGSLAMGATRGETMLMVLLPAALPGIMGGILLAASRAIGETMIVVMAAGLIATLTANPLEAVTTVTVQIVTLLIGDAEFDNPKTLVAFALGLVLFVVTLMLNVIAQHIVRRYREQYE